MTLPRPDPAVAGKPIWSYIGVFAAFHLLLPLALVPHVFSYTGVALVFVGNYVFGSLGINIGYHRLLTHRSFSCPRWLEHTFAVLGVCSLQDSPGRWVAIHRMHHQHSDARPDPHSPLVSFFWGHLGWLIVENRSLGTLSTYERYAKDVFRDRFYRRLHRNSTWLWVWAAHAALFFGIGSLSGWVMAGTFAEALRFGASIFVWGVIVRTVYVWHITWAVNSVAHLWGYRSYETGENSRNNWLVALLTNGEGWHNNHHGLQRSARHGHRWWEIDLTYGTIVLLQKVGLAHDVPTPAILERRGLTTAREPGAGIEPHAVNSPAHLMPKSSRSDQPHLHPPRHAPSHRPDDRPRGRGKESHASARPPDDL